MTYSTYSTITQFKVISRQLSSFFYPINVYDRLSACRGSVFELRGTIAQEAMMANSLSYTVFYKNP